MEKQTQLLIELGEEEDEYAIKNWLRSQYANSIRERKKGAVAEDFDRIATEFHRWVREVKDSIGLIKSTDFAIFIKRDFSFYSHQYHRLWKAWRELTTGLEEVL
jgi:hypothetical protein